MKKILTDTYVFQGAEINGIEEGPNGVWGPKYTGEYRQGFLIQAPGIYTKIVTFDVRDGEVYDESYRVDPNTIGQFIGILDSQGMRIFSNSIVSMKIPSENLNRWLTVRRYIHYDNRNCKWVLTNLPYELVNRDLTYDTIKRHNIRVVGVYYKNDVGEVIEHEF